MKKRSNFMFFAMAVIVLLSSVIVVLTLTGCTTTDPDKEYSDMPWNTPQQWEGSRSIPGMTPGY